MHSLAARAASSFDFISWNDSLVILLFNALLTINLIGLLSFICWRAGKKLYPSVQEGQLRSRFYTLCAAIVCIKIAYVAFFYFQWPEKSVYKDAARYFFEMQGIASAPWLWNPFTGEGPLYNDSAKMGMNWIYGFVMFLHNIDSLYSAFALNIFWGTMICLVVGWLTYELSQSKLAAILATAYAAIYPEILYWHARVLRENFTLFLVPLMAVLCIKFYDSRKLSYALAIAAVFIITLITRAQLSLFLFLIILFYGAYMIGRSILKAQLVRPIVFLGLVSLVAYFAFEPFKQQFAVGAGVRLFQYFVLDPKFWSMQFEMFLENLPQVLEFSAGGTFGLAGMILFPFVTLTAALFLGMIFNFRKIFGARTKHAAMVLFLICCFIFMLAAFQSFSIRVRSTVAPLILALIAPTLLFYWRSLRLPRIVIKSNNSKDLEPRLEV